MSTPALAAVPALIDGTGTKTKTFDVELRERAGRDDYHEWLSTAQVAGGCVRPIRLRGTIRNIDVETGEVLSGLDTGDAPDKVIYLPCRDRRASVCPPCAMTYRFDTYQLFRAGLSGGKGVPASIASHPCVFATFTAPSFGPVHTRVVTSSGKTGAVPPQAQGELLPARAQDLLRAAAPGRRRLSRRAAVPGLLGLQRRGGGERARARAVAPRRHCNPPPLGQARSGERRPCTDVVCEGGRVPAPRADPLPRSLPPRRLRSGPPGAHCPAAARVQRRRAG